MSLIVQKYGGTSVSDISRMMHVARKIKATQNAGHSVVVVVSAMGHETDRLDDLAHQIMDNPTPRELDVLLATGEQVSIALLCMALHSMGCPARSYTGAQVAIRTNSVHTKSRIEHIDDEKIRADLAQGMVVVVAGFQGIDAAGNTTTLGRGGSDTTAVALAAALKADECQIYTDVDGVYTTDPRMVSDARRMPRVTFDEMLELSSLGAQVLQIRAVEFAGKYNVPLRVLSTFKEGSGTLITFDEKSMEQPIVSGIAFSREEAKLIIRGVPDKPGIAGQILGPISDANIEVDMIVQILGDDGNTDFAFTVHRRDYEQAFAILREVNDELGAGGVLGDAKIAKVSLVGVGMRSHAGIASTMFKVLGAEGINIQLVATSEIKVSVLVDEKYLELGVRALHEAFRLHEDPYEEEAERRRLRA
ncbi:aspartate kinase [Candidatus Berkiella aquae]|uniref:Aspartokinase n=1 Tax=Candidatus Berkiella aquae TaxID=295108 RepID=A0A0Q9YV23_9GAMM|nr:aspartate kinase [Candidatus Berkiella aquae]MCS5712242.1 aspartate kinase [Candidatus Berkiella aquae]